jgi:membrane protease YdiL (CAAX protease family)
MTVETQSCPNCQTQSFPGATFCHNCGLALSLAAVRPAGSVPWNMGDIGKAIGIVIVVLIATSIPVAIVATEIAGSEDIERDPTALTIALGASVFLELALLLTALHFTVRKYGASIAALGLRAPERGGFWLSLGLGFGLVMAGLGLNLAYFGALSLAGIEPDTALPEEVFQDPGPLITIGVLSLLFAPFMEEVFFRGFVFGGLRPRWGVLWAAVASGMLFAVAHIGNPGTIYLIPPVAAIGAIFAWGYAYTGSLMASFFAHFLFNLVAFGAGIAEHS